MSKAGRVLLIIGSAWMIIVCGCGYFSLFRVGVATRWEQVSVPPESLSLLKLGEAGEILAQTTDGTLYEFHYGKNSSWKEIAQPSESPAIGGSCVTGTGNYLVFPPPGKVKSRVSENCVYMESAYHLEVALLENGQIWVWEYERYAYSELFMMFFLLVACAAGALILLLGLGLMIFQKINSLPYISKIDVAAHARSPSAKRTPACAPTVHPQVRCADQRAAGSSAAALKRHDIAVAFVSHERVARI